MKNKCIYLRQRKHQNKYYGYCIKHKKKVPLFCKEKCIEFPKIINLKKKTYKQAKKENLRFSILIPDKNKCVMCHSNYHLTWHEVFRGRNRSNSMKYGLCLRLCEKCHEKYQDNKEFNDYWHVEGQKKFTIVYPELKFEDIFHINYL